MQLKDCPIVDSETVMDCEYMSSYLEALIFEIQAYHLVDNGRIQLKY